MRLNQMEFERIKNEACKEVFEGTEYRWVDQLDNTEEADKKVRDCTDEEELKKYWTDYFTDMLNGME